MVVVTAMCRIMGEDEWCRTTVTLVLGLVALESATQV